MVEEPEEKSKARKYISQYVALDVKTIIPILILIVSISFGIYSTFASETKTSIKELWKASSQCTGDIVGLKSDYMHIQKSLDKIDKNLEKNNDLVLKLLIKERDK